MLNGAPQAPAKRALVWLVGGSAEEAEEARRGLSRRHELEVFEDAAVATEQLAAGGRPNVLVVDWQLPEGSAAKLFEYVRAIWNEEDFPVLAITLEGSPRAVAQALAA